MISRREMLSDLAMGALATLTPGCLTGKRGGELRTVRIAHCGDPQFGFSNPKDAAASYAADRARFERLIDDVNEWRPDLCFLAGDMTHRAADLERDWPRLLKLFRVPVVATAGNHDMGQNLTRVERFASYREAGVRFYLAGHTHCMIARAQDGITILNAETTCRNFDGRPMGYRRMEIAPDGDYSWTFRRI